ncbi:hypothetical protein L2E82_40561 [Cichorium intybus]|uniref:Uncharacterized protein n=1 Tax=Cichorium intybus TaxID=13427 RepID=A0ACB9AM36_CICIN|nr:hypothetical protein L2E82_40561 [Cichorium intybus]
MINCTICLLLYRFFQSTYHQISYTVPEESPVQKKSYSLPPPKSPISITVGLFHQVSLKTIVAISLSSFMLLIPILFT